MTQSLRHQGMLSTTRRSSTATQHNYHPADDYRYDRSTADRSAEVYVDARNEATARFRDQQQLQMQERRIQLERYADPDDVYDTPPSSPRSNAHPPKAPSLLERMRIEKNRVVQRCLVACRLAEPSRDPFFKLKKKEFADAIALLQDTKHNVQKLTAQVQKFTGTVASFAGDSVSYAHMRMHEVPRQTFQQSAQQIEDHAAAFSAEVQQQIVAALDERVATLEQLYDAITERCDLQVDVDYAKRKLTVAQQKGDINQIAERKFAVTRAQQHCAAATKTLIAQLAATTADQQSEIQALLTQFSHLLLEFFQFGDQLLAPNDDHMTMHSPVNRTSMPAMLGAMATPSMLSSVGAKLEYKPAPPATNAHAAATTTA